MVVYLGFLVIFRLRDKSKIVFGECARIVTLRKKAFPIYIKILHPRFHTVHDQYSQNPACDQTSNHCDLMLTTLRSDLDEVLRREAQNLDIFSIDGTWRYLLSHLRNRDVRTIVRFALRFCAPWVHCLFVREYPPHCNDKHATSLLESIEPTSR